MQLHCRSSLPPELERHLVDHAPRPGLARLDRAQDGVFGLAGVPGRVAVRGGVAAADLPAALAHAQMDPLAADLEALLAAGDVGGRLEELDLVEMGADGHGGVLSCGVTPPGSLTHCAGVPSRTA